jgi:hypothetical protein
MEGNMIFMCTYQVDRDKQTDTQASWIMGWSGQCTFPTVTPVVEDDTARKLVKAMLASQQG